MSLWCAASQNIPVCLMGFGFSPLGNKFKVHRPKEPSGEGCANPWYLKPASDFLVFTIARMIVIEFPIAHLFKR